MCFKNVSLSFSYKKIRQPFIYVTTSMQTQLSTKNLKSFTRNKTIKCKQVLFVITNSAKQNSTIQNNSLSQHKFPAKKSPIQKLPPSASGILSTWYCLLLMQMMGTPSTFLILLFRSLLRFSYYQYFKLVITYQGRENVLFVFQTHLIKS